jgi:hypothetical protein
MCQQLAYLELSRIFLIASKIGESLGSNYEYPSKSIGKQGRAQRETETETNPDLFLISRPSGFSKVGFGFRVITVFLFNFGISIFL